MTAEPTILLGVGATKAGTTWLYEHLAQHPECHLRAIKELHYFDALENGGLGRQLKLQRARALRIVAHGGTRESVKARDVADWIAVLKAKVENVPAYLAYLTGGNRGARHLVADITPAYALLPEARLAAMARVAADVRVVYLMRDPVARMWSHVRMLAERAAHRADSVADAASALLDRLVSGQAVSGVLERGDYAAAVTRLRAAVPADRLMLMFQEDMLTAPGLARLHRFLGIGAAVADFGRRVFSGIPVVMRPDQLAAARGLLAPQYAFAARNFPDLPPAWRQNMVEGVA